MLVKVAPGISIPLHWNHNGHDSLSNHQPHDCLLNRLFRRRLKKISKLRVTGLCAGNSPGTGEFPAQMASNVENVSIWWRHHDAFRFISVGYCTDSQPLKSRGTHPWPMMSFYTSTEMHLLIRLKRFTLTITHCKKRSVLIKHTSPQIIGTFIETWGSSQNLFSSRGPFRQYGYVLTPSCISNYRHRRLGDEIIYPFPNFSGFSNEGWEWIINFTHILLFMWLLIPDGIKWFEIHPLT